MSHWSICKRIKWDLIVSPLSGKQKTELFLLSLSYFNVKWGVQNDIKREIQGFRGTRDYCARPHVDMQDNQSVQIPDQTNRQTNEHNLMGFFQDSANAEIFEVFYFIISRFILDHDLK